VWRIQSKETPGAVDEIVLLNYFWLMLKSLEIKAFQGQKFFLFFLKKCLQYIKGSCIIIELA